MVFLQPSTSNCFFSVLLVPLWLFYFFTKAQTPVSAWALAGPVPKDLLISTLCGAPGRVIC